jgi:hypothetical protein
MQPRLHAVCATGEKNRANPPYTEEMRYLRRFVQLMQPEFKHSGLPLPTELTAHSNTPQRLPVATGLSSVQIHAHDPGCPAVINCHPASVVAV